MNAIHLTPIDLVVAAVLILATGAVSFALRLDLEQRLFIAAVRTVVQLLLLGLVLRWIFALESAPAVLGLLALMIVVAGRAAVSRSVRWFPGMHTRALASIALSATVTGFTVTELIVHVDPWYAPQYVIPLFGMVLGNSLTGVSIGLDALLEALREKKDQIEMELAHGATGWEACRDHVAQAVRRGMIPSINGMNVAGIVSLPGMMTGQIIAGNDPFEAVKYQIVVMFMLATCTALGCVGIAVLSVRRLVNDRHQLLVDAIHLRAG